jgi:hypothetical protein
VCLCVCVCVFVCVCVCVCVCVFHKNRFDTLPVCTRMYVCALGRRVSVQMNAQCMSVAIVHL